MGTFDLPWIVMLPKMTVTEAEEEEELFMLQPANKGG